MKSKLISLILLLTSHLGATDKFVVLSPPKCGTHLIMKALSTLFDKQETAWLNKLPEDPVTATEQITSEGSFAVAHNWDINTLAHLVQKDYKIVFMLRDPRDHAISVLDWSYTPSWGGPKHITTIANRNERLIELISGSRGWTCYEFIKRRLNLLYMLPRQASYIVKFENLVGPNGGGSRQMQIKELRSLSKFLHSSISDEKIKEVADNLWGNTATFNVGKIGRWKEVMTPFHIMMYKAFYQEELMRLNYEPI
jgi:hypothetical protein